MAGKNLSPAANVFMYIDETNIFTSAQWFRYIAADPNLTVDLNKLIRIALDFKQPARRRIQKCKIFASYSSVKEKHFDEDLNVEVIVADLELDSNEPKKEKEVDTGLTAAAVEDIMEYKSTAGPGKTLILFSGDRDLCPVVEKALKHGYKVEHWAFFYNRNSKFKSLLPKECLFGIEKSLTHEQFRDVFYSEFKNESPFDAGRDDSVIASFKLPSDNVWEYVQDKFFDRLVAGARLHFKLPLVGTPLTSEDLNDEVKMWTQLVSTAKPKSPECKSCYVKCTYCKKESDFYGSVLNAKVRIGGKFKIPVDGEKFTIDLTDIATWNKSQEDKEWTSVPVRKRKRSKYPLTVTSEQKINSMHFTQRKK